MRKQLVKTYGRRLRPRARSVDSIGSENAAYEVARSTESITKQKANDGDEEDDEVTPLIMSAAKKRIPYSRSYSLDRDPHYQFLVYDSCSFLTSGLSISLAPQKQNSIVTIFAIWNTIIGSSVLAMPWSVQRAGLAVALILLLAVATLAVYTAYRLLQVQLKYGEDDIGEVPFLCKKLLGSWAEIVSRVFSLTVIFGANIIYWILMSNCLYHSVGYIVDALFDTDLVAPNETETVICPAKDNTNASDTVTQLTLFQKIWDLNRTVPIFLVLLVAPLLNFKSATFFTKFNSIGTLSVLYLIVFVIGKAFTWGINVEFVNYSDENYVSLFEPTFFAMSGMLPLSLFIHNIVITVMRNNRCQENNSRDLSVAYVLVVLTYVIVGFTFYVSFPLTKACIEDNLLNNFSNWDVPTLIARIFLFFQLLTVFPLLSYMLRIQVFSALNYPSYPSVFHVTCLNSLSILGCVLFAIFLPKIGTIIRFTGAICGFIYVFTIPCLLFMSSQKEENELTLFSIVLHTVIPCIGFVNLVAQFFVFD